MIPDMSNVTVKCSSCDSLYSATPDILGKKVKCAKCGEMFDVVSVENLPPTIKRPEPRQELRPIVSFERRVVQVMLIVLGAGAALSLLSLVGFALFLPMPLLFEKLMVVFFVAMCFACFVAMTLLTSIFVVVVNKS